MKHRKVSGKILKEWLFRKRQRTLACTTIDAEKSYHVVITPLNISFKKRDSFMEKVRYPGHGWSGISKNIQFYYRTIEREINVESDYNQEINRILYQKYSKEIPEQYQIKIDHLKYFKKLQEENKNQKSSKWELYWNEDKCRNIIVKLPARWEYISKDKWVYHKVEYRVYVINPETDTIELIYTHEGRISKEKVVEFSKLKK